MKKKNNKKVLLVGSSFSAAPLFFALKRYGFDISVCGSLPDDPCHGYADKSYFVDYSKPENLEDILSKGEYDYLVPSCNDYSYMSCSKVAANYNFPGFDGYNIALSLHTKDGFRTITKDLNIPSPSYFKYSSKQHVAESELKFPLLVKPTASFSGIGMTMVTHRSQLQSALTRANVGARPGEIVLEEFVEGSLHSHSAWLKNGKIHFEFFVDEYCTVYPYQVNCSHHPSSISDEVKNRVSKYINLISSNLKLTDGLIHTQFLKKGDDIYLIETMRRCPGDLFGKMIFISTGIDYADLFVRPFVDKAIDEIQMDSPHLPIGRHTISTKEKLVFDSLSFEIDSTSTQFVPLKNSGDLLMPAPFDKLGIIFSQFADYKTMRDVTPRFSELIKIDELRSKND